MEKAEVGPAVQVPLLSTDGESIGKVKVLINIKLAKT
jgi:hypothetical protein